MDFLLKAVVFSNNAVLDDIYEHYLSS